MILFAGILFTILYTALIAVIGGELVWYFDLASLTFVLVPLVFFLLITKYGKSLFGYIKSSLKKNYSYSEDELRNIASAAKSATKVTLTAGWFSFLIGLIIVLRTIDVPQMTGAYLSVMIISLLYSAGIGYFVLFPLQAWAEYKLSKRG